MLEVQQSEGNEDAASNADKTRRKQRDDDSPSLTERQRLGMDGRRGADGEAERHRQQGPMRAMPYAANIPRVEDDGKRVRRRELAGWTFRAAPRDDGTRCV